MSRLSKAGVYGLGTYAIASSLFMTGSIFKNNFYPNLRDEFNSELSDVESVADGAFYLSEKVIKGGLLITTLAVSAVIGIPIGPFAPIVYGIAKLKRKFNT